MRNLASEARPAPAHAGAGVAHDAAARSQAWRDLYRRAPGDDALAHDLLVQLDLDPAARSTHLALYVLSQEAVRRQARRRERIARILTTRPVRRMRLAWKRWLRGTRKDTPATASGMQHPRATAAAAEVPPKPAPAIESLTPQQMESELLMTTPDVQSAAHDAALRSATLERRLAVAKDLLLARLEQQMHDGPCITSPQALREWLCLRYAGLDHEVLTVLFLDAQHRLISAEPMFRGTLTETAVYPREIVKAALLRNAAAVAMVHNHPSAALEPSSADQFLTRQVAAALELVQVKLLDHFVVAGARMLSMAQRGLL